MFLLCLHYAPKLADLLQLFPSRSRGQNSNTLTITRSTPPDEGMYYCVANKEGISVKSNRVRVRVNGEKLFISIYKIKILHLFIFLKPCLNI